MNVQYYDMMPSPVGPLLLTSDGVNLTGLYMQAHAKTVDTGCRDKAPFKQVVAQLQAYFAGERRQFDLPLAPVGTDFQRRVWRALQGIPFGQTSSYGELAGRLGKPTASRAVGMANGRNPISIVVPCHRVIGADGSLTGYGGGLPRKRWLLQHEGVQLQ